MTQRVYKTAQGKTIDLGALQLRNENTRAVGNMSVNARGDLLDSSNRPIDTKKEQVARHYQKQVTNVVDDKVVSSRKQSEQKPKFTKKAPEVDNIVTDDIDVVSYQENAEVENTEETTGLAAAIARARQVRQEPLKTPRQTAQDKSGIKKI